MAAHGVPGINPIRRQMPCYPVRITARARLYRSLMREAGPLLPENLQERLRKREVIAGLFGKGIHMRSLLSK